MIVFNKFNLVFLVLLIVLSGCVVQSRQLNGFLELLAKSSKDHSVNSWLVSYSGYESIVYAVSVPNGVLFSNSAGDQVLFDGWVIRKVRGMGRFRLNSDIDDDLNIRIFKVSNRTMAKHTCKQWGKQNNSPSVRFSQRCMGRESYENSILIHDNVNISLIRQIVDERYTALTLTKLK